MTMTIMPFKFKTEQETLAANLINLNNNTPPKFVFLHGGGAGTKERVQHIAEPVLQSGRNILTFDFSGHGESTGDLKKSSLEKRVYEASSVIDQYASREPLIICGASMGGYIAIKLLDLHKVDTLILFCPAVYNKEAYSVRFDSGFTDIIRRPNSWTDTDIIPTLNAFTGRLLIIIGEADEVIPSGVIELIAQQSTQAPKKEVFTISACPHKIFDWMLDKPDVSTAIIQKMKEYL